MFAWGPDMMLDAYDQGVIIMFLIEVKAHMPFIDNKANREKIADTITIAIYNKQIPPISQKDVDNICFMIDNMVNEEGELL